MEQNRTVEKLSKQLARSINRDRRRKYAHPPDHVHPEVSAKEAGLHYISDISTPGICRRKTASGFKYLSPDGKPIQDEAVMQRIKSLAIPPAWTRVWISPDANGHLQATGRDARGRKQYRYHPRWRQVRDDTKYSRLIAFGHALPKIRKQVDEDLALRGLPRRKVLATLVRLLETTFIRVGNEEYAKNNLSFGLTTMRDDHVNINGSKMKFQFRGKSGKSHSIDVHDKYLTRIVKRCRDVPGWELFQYIDEKGRNRSVSSTDVNEYLKEISGKEFTAKDFRTWSGTMLAALALRELKDFKTATEAKKNIRLAVEEVAQRLGNTTSICRKCYIHPTVMDSYLNGTLAQSLERRVAREMDHSLRQLEPEEAAIMILLQREGT